MLRQAFWYVLLLAVPAAFALNYSHAGPVPTFIVSGLGIVPLAVFMGRGTEGIAERLGPRLGGLLNATAGNAAEFILAFVSLHKGLVDVVKASIIGSIIGNALLALGLSLLAGGLKHRRQSFDRVSAGLQANLLVLATIGLAVPTVLHQSLGKASETSLSEEVAAVLLGTYLLSVVFTVLTKDPENTVVEGHAGQAEEPGWGPGKSLLMLGVATLFVAFLSEFLAGAIEEAQQTGLLKAWGMSEVFLGVVLVAAVGNSAEIATAVMMAYRNRVEVTIHIAVGASLQVALLITPLLVFGSIWLAPEPMDLHFSVMELLAVVGSVLVVAFVAMDGQSHWMEGVLLLAVYVILAMAFYHVPAAG